MIPFRTLEVQKPRLSEQAMEVRSWPARCFCGYGAVGAGVGRRGKALFGGAPPCPASCGEHGERRQRNLALGLSNAVRSLSRCENTKHALHKKEMVEAEIKVLRRGSQKISTPKTIEKKNLSDRAHSSGTLQLTRQLERSSPATTQ